MALAAAFRRGMEEGQLTGAWRYLLIYEPPSLTPTIVGSFVNTPKGRVLFFPGASIAIETDDPTARFNGKRLDHITADPPSRGKSASHVAVRDLPHDESRGINYRSVPPPEHMIPWFSLLIPDFEGFSEAPARLIVRFPCPPRISDIQLFGQRLLADGGTVSLPVPISTYSDQTYLQFDVWLGRGAEWKTLRVRPLSWPYKPELVQDAPDGEQQVTVNRVDIDLGSDVGVAVLVLRPAGRLLEPRILRPTLSR